MPKRTKNILLLITAGGFLSLWLLGGHITGSAASLPLVSLLLLLALTMMAVAAVTVGDSPQQVSGDGYQQARGAHRIAVPSVSLPTTWRAK